MEQNKQHDSNTQGDRQQADISMTDRQSKRIIANLPKSWLTPSGSDVDDCDRFV